MDLRELLAIAAQRKLWLAVPTVLALMAALAFLILWKPYFPAATQLLLDPRGLQVVDKELTPSSQLSEAGMAVVESQMRVITSERVLLALVDKEHLDRDPEFVEASVLKRLLRIVGGALGLSSVEEAPTLRALRELQKDVSVQRGEKNYVIDVQVQTEDPVKSAHLADSLAQLYIDADFVARTDASRKAGASLSGRLDDLRDQVRASEDRVEAFKAQNNIVGPTGQLVSDQQLSELNAQLVTARAHTAELKVRSDQIESVRRGGTEADSIAEAVQSTTIGQLRGQLAEIRRRQAIAVTELGSRHPDVVLMASQVQSLQRQIRDELDRIAGSAKVDYERAKANEASLSRGLEDLKTNSIRTSEAFVHLRELDREADASRSVYESFLKRTKELGEQETVDTANARIISNAIPPISHAGPSRLLILVGAALAGLGLGAAGALTRDQLVFPVRSGRRLAAAVDLPILATVAGDTRRVRRMSAAASTMPWVAAASVDPSAALPMRRLARTVLTSASGGPSLVLIVSPSPGRQPLSAASLNLLAALKSAGNTVLFVDAHPDRSPSPPLEAARVQGAEPLRRRIGPSLGMAREAAPGTAWLPLDAAARGFAPAVLRQALMAQATGRDVLVVDAGSTRKDSLAASLAEIADHVILAVEEGRTAMDSVAAEIEALEAQSGNLRGITFVTASAARDAA